MKPLRLVLFLGSLMVTGAAAATSMSLNSFPSKVLPVLVQVDRHGHVREVSPATDLTPATDRMLRRTLDRWITQPARDHGRPVASQMIINLGLKADPRPDGRYDARFVYLSSSPVPSGSWYWVHVDGHRLALANRNDRTMTRDWPAHPGPRWSVPHRASPPVIQHATTRTAPVAVPGHPPHH